MPALTFAQVLAAAQAATPEQKVAFRAALKVGPTPEQAAASAAYVGKGFPCTATPPCGRTFRTVGRAAIHGVEAGGHTPA